MITHRAEHTTPTPRRNARRLVRGASVGLVLSVVGSGTAAFADTPAAWAQAPHVSFLRFAMVLFVIPLVVAGVIAALSALSSSRGESGYQPGQAWRGENEWFGGPQQGVSAVDTVGDEKLLAEQETRGGTSARW